MASGKMKRANNSLDALDVVDYKTGDSLKPGTYPGRFVKFGEPFIIESQFGEQEVLKAYFVVRRDDGSVQATNRLLSTPKRGVIHKMSKLYKTLRALDNGSGKYVDEDGAIASGFKFASVTQDPCMVEVELNKNDFPNVANISRPVKGVEFPATEELESLMEEDEQAFDDSDIPF